MLDMDLGVKKYSTERQSDRAVLKSKAALNVGLLRRDVSARTFLLVKHNVGYLIQ